MLHFAAKRGGVPPSSFGNWVAVATAVLAAVVLLSVLAALPAAGQEPTLPVLPPTDPRSEGQGPGLSGGPLIAAVAVIAIGLIAALATVAYVRLTARDR